MSSLNEPKQTLNIRFAQEPQNSHQPEALQAFYKQQVLPALQDTLHEFESSLTIKPEEIEIDLNKFSAAASYDEIKALIRKEIEQYLLQTAAQQDATASVSSPEPDGLEIVSQFFSQGVLPWYYKPEKGFRISNLLEEHFQKHPRALLLVLQKALASA